MKVEAAVLGSPSLRVLIVSVDVKLIGNGGVGGREGVCISGHNSTS